MKGLIQSSTRNTDLKSGLASLKDQFASQRGWNGSKIRALTRTPKTFIICQPKTVLLD